MENPVLVKGGTWLFCKRKKYNKYMISAFNIYKKEDITNSVQPPNMEATSSKLRNWEIQNNAKLAEQIKEMAKYQKIAKIAETKMQEKAKYKKSKKQPNTKNAKYKRNAKLADTNGRKSDLVRRPLCKQLDPKVFCEALGQVAHSVVSCLYQRSDQIIKVAAFDLIGKPKGSMMTSPTPP